MSRKPSIKPSIKQLGFAYLLLSSLSFGVYAVEADIAQLDNYLQQRDTDAAWSLAQRLAATRLGEPEFDYRYGLAALEAGAVQHALFAFERVLMAQPDHHRARLELGRAHYLAGNDKAARAAFDQVLATDPPAGVRATVDQFMTAIQRREANVRTQFSGYADARVGYDSNVASSTSDEQIRVPALGVVSLSEDGRAVSDRFLEKNIGLRIAHPFSKRYAWTAEFSFKDRENFSTDNGDIRVAGASIGPVIVQGQNRWRVPVQIQSLSIDNDSYRRLGTLGLEWTRRLDPRNDLMLTGEYGSLRYPGQGTRNVHLGLAGLVWSHRLLEPQINFNAGLFFGAEDNQDSSAAYNAKQYHGLRLGAQWKPLKRHTLYAVSTAQWTEHDANDPVFGVTRDEHYVELRLGWDYAFRPNWSLRLEASRAQNDANIALYEYTRNQVYAGVRYQFD